MLLQMIVHRILILLCDTTMGAHELAGSILGICEAHLVVGERVGRPVQFFPGATAQGKKSDASPLGKYLNF